MRKEECKVQSVPIVERKCVYKQSKRDFRAGSETYDKKERENQINAAFSRLSRSAMLSEVDGDGNSKSDLSIRFDTKRGWEWD